ncbi:MAG TPA: gamma-glutamylcyclotransferase family protein [Candidatus Eisenbacteria bacterium]|nr:gamma-glutamylcyclotransferase family protein [Candidatus Eisenbacteria bacterium]
MIDRLFTYGTLELPEVFEKVAGGSRRSAPAVLHGYERFLVRGECFPGIAERHGESTRGTLYFDVDPAMLARIDRFEGPQFTRQSVGVVTQDGERLAAFVYTVAPEDLGDESWDVRVFMERHLQEFLAGRSSWIE